MTSRTGIRRIVMIGLAAAIASPVSAQVLDRPSRAFRGLFGGGPPPDPNRTRQELTLTTNLVGGYDDVFSPSGSGPDDLLRPRESAYTAFAEMNVRYWLGRAARSLTINGRGFTNTYSIGTTSTLGGDAQAVFETSIGRGNRLSGRQTFRYEPLLSVGGFGPIESGVEPSLLPAGNPATAVAEQSARRIDSAVSLSRTWTRRQSTTVTANTGDYHQIGDSTQLAFSSRTSGASAGYGLALTRRARLQAAYNYSAVTMLDADDSRRTSSSNAIEGGYAYERPLSPTRVIELSFGAGAAYVSSVDPITAERFQYWTPSGRAAVSLDLARSWSLRTNFSRGLTVLEGVARQSFYTNAAAIQLGGLLSRRVDATVTAGMATGRAVALSDELSNYRSFTGTAQLRWALARCCAVLGNYNYYRYELEGVPTVQGFPMSMNRNAARLGFSIWLPLYGAYHGAPETRDQRRR